MNVAPDCVFITVLSLISLRNWTCGAISEPNAAVAIRQPPPSSRLICCVSCAAGAGVGAGVGDGVGVGSGVLGSGSLFHHHGVGKGFSFSQVWT